MNPVLIYCAGGNNRYRKIAVGAGFEYGARLPDTVYGPLYFADQNWKKPDRTAYMKGLDRYRPYMATVLDWERLEQLDEVLDWAEEAAQYVSEVLIIPKVHNSVRLLPRAIGNKHIRLGYSVPTRHGGTELMISEFFGWPVHLLGGSPKAQVNIWRYLGNNVLSTDGNMAMLMANKYCTYFDSTRTDCWVTLQNSDGQKWTVDAPYEAFRRSCVNIKKYWEKETNNHETD